MPEMTTKVPKQNKETIPQVQHITVKTDDPTSLI